MPPSKKYGLCFYTCIYIQPPKNSCAQDYIYIFRRGRTQNCREQKQIMLRGDYVWAIVYLCINWKGRETGSLRLRIIDISGYAKQIIHCDTHNNSYLEANKEN